MRLTLEALSKARGISAEDAAQATYLNALRLFGLA